jgi:hypothetical protein
MWKYVNRVGGRSVEHIAGTGGLPIQLRETASNSRLPRHSFRIDAAVRDEPQDGHVRDCMEQVMVMIMAITPSLNTSMRPLLIFDEFPCG